MATDTTTDAPPASEAPPRDASSTASPTAPSAAPSAASPEPRTPDKRPAKGDAKADAKAKGGKAKGAKKGSKDSKDSKASKGSEEGGDGPNVAAHPRAVRGIARAKSWGGLAGFVLGGYLSLPTNTIVGAGVRALLAGIVCYVAVWAGAVFVWRRLVMLEIKGREQELLAAAQAAIAQRESPPAPGERPTARAAS